jgi:hypothetical protein
MGSVGGGDAGMLLDESIVWQQKQFSQSRPTADYCTKSIDYNYMNSKNIKKQLIRPRPTYAISVLILNALWVHLFTAVSP